MPTDLSLDDIKRSNYNLKTTDLNFVFDLQKVNSSFSMRTERKGSHCRILGRTDNHTICKYAREIVQDELNEYVRFILNFSFGV